jgi:hypothetical protein
MKLASLMSTVLAGGLLFGSAVGLADKDKDKDNNKAATSHTVTVTTGGSGKASGSGIRIQIDGVDQMVDEQISHALDQLANDPNIPKSVRDNVTSHLKRVKDKLHDKLG